MTSSKSQTRIIDLWEKYGFYVSIIDSRLRISDWDGNPVDPWNPARNWCYPENAEIRSFYIDHQSRELYLATDHGLYKLNYDSSLPPDNRKISSFKYYDLPVNRVYEHGGLQYVLTDKGEIIRCMRNAHPVILDKKVVDIKFGEEDYTYTKKGKDYVYGRRYDLLREVRSEHNSTICRLSDSRVVPSDDGILLVDSVIVDYLISSSGKYTSLDNNIPLKENQDCVLKFLEKLKTDNIQIPNFEYPGSDIQNHTAIMDLD